MDKQGVIEIQFNWIFILMAGSLLLLFFVGLTISITKNAREGLNYDIIIYLDEILTGVEASTLTEHQISLPDTALEIGCDYYSIKGSSLEGNPLTDRIVFSPDRIKEKMLTYTLPWESPYKTAYFIYLTSPYVHYALVRPTDTSLSNLNELQDYSDSLYNAAEKGALPKNINIEIYDESDVKDITNRNYEKMRFIFFTDPEAISFGDIRGIDDEDVSAVYIQPASTPQREFPEGYGTVTYYKFDGPDFKKVNLGRFSYFNRASLIGAIFSEDSEMYKCNMEKAAKKHELVSDVLLERVKSLYAGPDPADYCSQYDDYDSDTQDKILQIRDLPASGLASGYDNLFTESYGPGGLEGKNEDLLKKACPSIY